MRSYAISEAAREAGVGSRECSGRLRHREEQRESAVRCGQQQSVARAVRTAPRRPESGGADDRWHSLWRPGVGGSQDFSLRTGERSAECLTFLERCSREEVTDICSYAVFLDATHQFMMAEARAKGQIRAGQNNPAGIQVFRPTDVV